MTPLPPPATQCSSTPGLPFTGNALFSTPLPALPTHPRPQPSGLICFRSSDCLVRLPSPNLTRMFLAATIPKRRLIASPDYLFGWLQTSRDQIRQELRSALFRLFHGCLSLEQVGDTVR